MNKSKIGILLCNIGTPDAPTTKAVRKFLKEFLSDRRVIELSPLIWQPLLRTTILPFRPKKLVKLYQKIWTEQGSPLLNYTLDLVEKLKKQLLTEENEIVISVGMRYGNPSIQDSLEEFRKKSVKTLFILPMFPQYSATTTASTFDSVASALKRWRELPELHMINRYFSHVDYIDAISHSIRSHWDSHGKNYLLFSFHGIPQKYIQMGDPYADECHKTSNLIAEKLQLKHDEWSISFQSRLGPTKWLKPYTDIILRSLPENGIEHLQVVCPGFSVDCLETLEEISLRGKETFLAAGGKTFSYIPALNSSDIHISMLAKIIQSHLSK